MVPIKESLRSSIREFKYTKPTPIQAASWPSSFKGRDVLAIAKTGSGKTCGYLLPAMNEILKKGIFLIFYFKLLNNFGLIGFF